MADFLQVMLKAPKFDINCCANVRVTLIRAERTLAFQIINGFVFVQILKTKSYVNATTDVSTYWCFSAHKRALTKLWRSVAKAANIEDGSRCCI